MSAPKSRPDVDATRSQLLAFGCGYAAEQLGQPLSQAVHGEIPPQPFLDRLLAAELFGREERRVKTSLKVSNLPDGQMLVNFDFVFLPGIERRRIDTLATCAWVRDGETVHRFGSAGNGVRKHGCSHRGHAVPWFGVPGWPDARLGRLGGRSHG